MWLRRRHGAGGHVPTFIAALQFKRALFRMNKKTVSYRRTMLRIHGRPRQGSKTGIVCGSAGVTEQEVTCQVRSQPLPVKETPFLNIFLAFAETCLAFSLVSLAGFYFFLVTLSGFTFYLSHLQGSSGFVPEVIPGKWSGTNWLYPSHPYRRTQIVLSIRCILGDIRLWVGDTSTCSFLV